VGCRLTEGHGTLDVDRGESGAENAGPDQHFATTHLLGTLKYRTVTSGVIRSSAQGMQFLLTLGYNAALARLLTPRDFGLVAMVMTIIGFLQIFRDMQLSTATIQRPDVTHAQVSNLFWLNVAVSGTISVLLAAVAPLIAVFYHEPELIKIAWALSSYFILNGTAGQHVALLTRQMRFGVLSAVEVGSMAASLPVGVVLALVGYGYWSLIITTLAQAVLRVIAVWAVSGWRPQAPVFGAGTRPLISFGANLTLAGLLHSVSLGSDSLLIGRVYGSHTVGLYTRAAALLSRPIEQLINPIYAVTVPALSRLQEEPSRYRKFYLQVFQTLALAAFVFTGLALPLSRPLTLTILGPRWEESAVIFAGLSFAALYVPLSSAASWLYTSQGRGTDMLGLSTIEAAVTTASVIVALPYGAAAVAIAYSLSGLLIKLPLTFRIAGRVGPVSSWDLWSSYLLHLPVGITVAATTVFMLRLTATLPPYQQLLVCGSTGLLAGAVAIFLSPPSRRTFMTLSAELIELREARAQKMKMSAAAAS
jgi:O-antigen/teichoic acid export membrane protein